MEVGTVVHVFVRDVADHQKCAECAKKLYDYQYIIYILVMYRKWTSHFRFRHVENQFLSKIFEIFEKILKYSGKLQMLT